MGLFDAQEVESTGFAFGFDRIMEAYNRQEIEIPQDSTTRTLIVPLKTDFRGDAIKLAQKLRQNDIITDVDLKGRKLKKNLSYANAHNINKVIILGAKEVEENTATIKDMASKEQVTVPQDEIVDTILN